MMLALSVFIYIKTDEVYPVLAKRGIVDIW